MNTQTTPIKCNNFVATNTVSNNLVSALISKLRHQVKNRLQNFQQYKSNRIDRQAFQSLVRLDDRVLDDIGVTRGDVIWANNLPLAINAAQELNKISKIRRREEG